VFLTYLKIDDMYVKLMCIDFISDCILFEYTLNVRV